MPHEFIIPNVHVILVHYPLALLSMGAIIEFLGMFFWRRSAFRAAGRWMILVGALSMVPAALTGLYGMSDVNRTADNFDAPGITWAEVREQSKIQGDAWEFMTRHAWLNAFGSAAILLLVVLWLASSDAWRRRLHLIYLLVLLGALGVILAGAWYGGEMVYRFGIGVNEKPAAEVVESSDAPPAVKSQADWKTRVAYYADPLQVHVFIAGWAIALAFAALGVSLRGNAAANDPNTRYDTDIASAFSSQPAPYPQVRPALPPHYQTQDPAVAAALRPPKAPRARFWLLAALLAIATALTGWWTLAHFSETWDINRLWQLVMNESDAGGKRRMAHFLTGTGIVVLLLVLAVVSRLPFARRFLVLLLSLVLLAAVVGQIWFGSLLMFDSNSGPWDKFNAAEETIIPSGPPATTTGPTATVAP